MMYVSVFGVGCSGVVLVMMMILLVCCSIICGSIARTNRIVGWMSESNMVS